MRGDNIWIIAAAILLMLLVMSAIQLVLIRRRRQLERQYKDLEQTISDDEQYRRAVDENRNYRHIRHDLKKQERVMAMVAEGTGITKYTGNIVLDTVLTQEYSDAALSGIVMNIDVTGEFDTGLSDKEIVSLFANLLDNAREACERCGRNGGQTPIRIAISIKRFTEGPDPMSLDSALKGPDPTSIDSMLNQGPDPYLLIAVENSKPETEHPDTADMKTSKADKENHGYGMAIIRDIVQRYNGEIHMQDEHDMFRTEIRIPL